MLNKKALAAKSKSVKPEESGFNGEKAVEHDDAVRRQLGKAIIEVLCEQAVQPDLMERLQGDGDKNSGISKLEVVSKKVQEPANGKEVIARNPLARKYKKIARKPKLNSSGTMDTSISI